MPIGLQTFFQQNLADCGDGVRGGARSPDDRFFAVLNRYFSMGGTGGSLANR
jgi:multiple sugar transport system permease protein